MDCARLARHLHRGEQFWYRLGTIFGTIFRARPKLQRRLRSPPNSPQRNAAPSPAPQTALPTVNLAKITPRKPKHRQSVPKHHLRQRPKLHATLHPLSNLQKNAPAPQTAPQHPKTASSPTKLRAPFAKMHPCRRSQTTPPKHQSRKCRTFTSTNQTAPKTLHRRQPLKQHPKQHPKTPPAPAPSDLRQRILRRALGQRVRERPCHARGLADWPQIVGNTALGPNVLFVVLFFFYSSPLLFRAFLSFFRAFQAAAAAAGAAVWARLRQGSALGELCHRGWTLKTSSPKTQALLSQ